MLISRHFAIGMVALVGVTAACADGSTLTNPSRRPTPGAASAAVQGVDRNSFDVPVSFEGPLSWVTCLDPNNLPIAHVNGVSHISSVTTPSGTTITTALFEIDRSTTWVLYNGLTYHIARGRPGKDDISHIITGPGGLYIETDLEPDFEVTDDPSQRLQLNFHFQIVIDPSGTARVTKSTGSCPLIV